MRFGDGRQRLLVAFLLAIVAAPLAFAEPRPIELTPSAKRNFARIQEQWLRWLGDSYQDEAGDREVSIAQDMLVAAEALGSSSLPELGRAAAVRALVATREGKVVQAQRALAGAELLAPGLPEISFVAAKLAWSQGQYLPASRAWVQGWLSLVQDSAARRLLLLNVSFGLVLVVVASGALFLVLLVATRGATVFERLVDRMPGPRPVGIGLALGILLWPVVLPPFGFWLLPWWSAVVWAQATRTERVVIVSLWIVAASVPVLVASRQATILREGDPVVRSLDAVEQRQLTGALAHNVGALVGRLPEDPAAIQLVADVHRRLGQWDIAAKLLRRVLELEPANFSAMTDLGVDAFRRGDFGAAAQYFQQATTAGPNSAIAWYNLSQAFSESYQFDDQRSALDRARSIDTIRVSQWIQSPPEDRVLVAEGGIERLDEVRLRLLAADGEAVPSPSPTAEAAAVAPEPTPVAKPPAPFPAWGSLALPLLLLVLALGIRPLVGPRAESLPEGFTWRAGFGTRALRILVPGLTSSESGEGLATFGAVALPLCFALAPVMARISYALPIGCDVGALATPFAVAGLSLVLVARVVWDLRSES